MNLDAYKHTIQLESCREMGWVTLGNPFSSGHVIISQQHGIYAVILHLLINRKCIGVCACIIFFTATPLG